jgi:hypothetical protein
MTDHRNAGPDVWAAILGGFHWAWVILLSLAAWLGKALYDTAITQKFLGFEQRLKSIDSKQDVQMQMLVAMREEMAYFRAKIEK